MKKLFTFILDYEGGTYIKQIKGFQLDKAFDKWIENINSSELEIENENLIIDDIDKDFSPIDGLTNVWCTTFYLGNKLALVHIVETVG